MIDVVTQTPDPGAPAMFALSILAAAGLLLLATTDHNTANA